MSAIRKAKDLKAVIFDPPAQPWPELPTDISIDFDQDGQARQVMLGYPGEYPRMDHQTYQRIELGERPYPNFTQVVASACSST